MRHARDGAMARRTRWVLLAIVSAVALALVAAAGAATQNRSHTIDFKDTAKATIIDTGAITPEGAQICNPCIPDVLSPYDGATGIGARLEGGLDIEWVNPVKVDLTYTDSLVRQGETLDMKDVVATHTGKVKVSAFVKGFAGVFNQDPEEVGVPWVLARARCLGLSSYPRGYGRVAAVVPTWARTNRRTCVRASTRHRLRRKA